jgi:hypothetical protein
MPGAAVRFSTSSGSFTNFNVDGSVRGSVSTPRWLDELFPSLLSLLVLPDVTFAATDRLGL